MRYIATLALLIAVALPAAAGQLGLTWDFVSHPPPPYGYVLLRDGVPWANVSPVQDPLPSDPTRTGFVALNLPPSGGPACVLATYQVQAVNAGGESGASAAAASIPRPAGPGGIGTIEVLLNAGGVHQITGDYFPANVEVTANGEPITIGVDRQSCQLIEIPTTPGLPVQVCVVNPALPNSPSCWNQPSPFAPTNVEFF